MSTTEARDAARALFDALVGGALASLKTASVQLSDVKADGSELQAKISSALPSDAPLAVGRFLIGLAAAQKLDQLPGVIREFEQFVQATGSGNLDADVTSAVELDQKQRDHITNELRSRYGDQLQVAFDVDESLIGGLIIRVGDQVLDNSLRTRMGAMQRNMAAG